MELVAKDAFTVLKEKGVTHLHHANTVLTSCAFLRRHQLVSRGTKVSLGLDQTEQASDTIDQAFGIFNDIFLDSVDIHSRANKRNIYGPVLFVLDLNKLAQLPLATFWVTKSNPIDWIDNTPIHERWFSSIQDLRDNFVVGRFNQMIVLRSCGGVLQLKDCLTRIELDDPAIEYKKGLGLFGISLGALIVSHKQSGIKGRIPITRHKCRDGCTCVAQYAEDKVETTKMFFPY